MAVVEPIPFEEMDAELRELLAPRVERLGYLGEFFQVAAHQPRPLAAFVRFTDALKEALPWRVTEAIALTIASETENAYEQVQHERLALSLGMPSDEVEMILSSRLSSPPFEAEVVAAADLARCCAHGAGRNCRRRFRALCEVTSAEIAVGSLLLCGRYLAHAAIANTLELDPPVGSPIKAGDVG